MLFVGLGYYWWQNLHTATVHKQSEVFLERLKNVAKLSTVEGHYSEIYTYKDFWKYDISFLRKQALVRIQAKVSAGIDLEGMNISADEAEKKITLGPIPEAQILSIDHELDYYDLDEGTFNSFSAEDLTTIQAEGKSLIRKAALESNLLIQSNQQLDEFLKEFTFLLQSMDWQVEILMDSKEIGG